VDFIASIPSVLGAAAVVPPFLYLLSLTLLDERPQPPVIVTGCFVLGGLSIFLLEWAQFLPFVISDFGVLYSFLQAMADTAAPEEAAKVLILLLFARGYMAYDHPLEGVIYGAAIGLGFAAYENLVLLATMPDEWRDHSAIRNVLTVPVHGALGVIAGVYVARARFGDTFTGRHDTFLAWRNYALAWVVPTFLHGLYNFPLLLVRNSPGFRRNYAPVLQITAFLFGVIVMLLATRLIYRVSAAEEAVWARHARWSLLGPRAWRLDIIGFAAGFLGALMILVQVKNYLDGMAFTGRQPQSVSPNRRSAEATATAR
jgi:RsiW-degrading membrane proteinase PrsW (M82 family)